MPRYFTKLRNGDGNAWKYALPVFFVANCEVVEHQRKYWAAHRDEMIQFQKECASRRDIDGAKFFKEESRAALKMYRAACLILPHYAANWSGDCSYQDAYDWPVELFDQIDYIFAVASL